MINKMELAKSTGLTEHISRDISKREIKRLANLYGLTKIIIKANMLITNFKVRASSHGKIAKFTKDNGRKIK